MVVVSTVVFKDFKVNHTATRTTKITKITIIPMAMFLLFELGDFGETTGVFCCGACTSSAILFIVSPPKLLVQLS